MSFPSVLLESQISSQLLVKSLILTFFHQSFISWDVYDRALGHDVIMMSQRQCAPVRGRTQYLECVIASSMVGGSLGPFDHDKARQNITKKHRRERQIIDRSFDGNFGGFGPLLSDLWSFQLEQSASESPAFPFFLLLVQLKILKRLLNGSRGEETVNNKTQTQGLSFLFLFLSTKGI